MKAMADSRPNEFELIARLTRDLPSRPDVDQAVGDDCAVLDLGGNMLLLATCSRASMKGLLGFFGMYPLLLG